jgi:cation:H+ antiporter
MPLWRALLLVLISLAAMVWGADLLIDGSSAIAMPLGQQFGVPQTEMERIIGLTVVAVGTSLPELFASLMAARRGETDMAVGNIIGSVTFNILSVIGVASAITPIQNAWNPFLIDYAVMFSLAIALWVFLHTHRAIVRWEGTLLFLAYILYIIYTFYI